MQKFYSRNKKLYFLIDWMITSLDVAAYILSKMGGIPAIKLQKLAYYSHAWSLVWDEAPLFHDRIEAWANGPVIPELYRAHQGQYFVGPNQSLNLSLSQEGDASKLSDTQIETIDAVLDFYGSKTSQWLSDLTHREQPWKNARVGLADGERGNSQITNAAMMEYYSSIQNSSNDGPQET